MIARRAAAWAECSRLRELNQEANSKNARSVVLIKVFPKSKLTPCNVTKRGKKYKLPDVNASKSQLNKLENRQNITIMGSVVDVSVSSQSEFCSLLSGSFRFLDHERLLLNRSRFLRKSKGLAVSFSSSIHPQSSSHAWFLIERYSTREKVVARIRMQQNRFYRNQLILISLYINTYSSDRITSFASRSTS